LHGHAGTVGPLALPGGTDHIGVFGLAQTAVVAAQGPVQVAVFDVQIEAQDGAAVAQVGAHLEQVVARGADLLDPEGHDLHIAPGAHGGQGVFLEATFHLDQAQDQRGVQPRPGGFVMD